MKHLELILPYVWLALCLTNLLAGNYHIAFLEGLLGFQAFELNAYRHPVDEQDETSE